MTYRCCWCCCDILDWREATTFLSKAIHKECFDKLKREFKKKYRFVIPKKDKFQLKLE